MSKLAVLPNVEATPEMILEMAREHIGNMKTVFVVIEGKDGKWLPPIHNSCSLSDIYFAGAVIQHHAIKVGTKE